MNKERMLQLAEHVESIGKGETDGTFYMHAALANESDECGAVGCLAGHAVFLFDKSIYRHFLTYRYDPHGDPNVPDLIERARCLLDINIDQMDKLFTPEGWDSGDRLGHEALFSAEHGAKAVRLMLEGDDNPWQSIKDQIGSAL